MVSVAFVAIVLFKHLVLVEGVGQIIVSVAFVAIVLFKRRYILSGRHRRLVVVSVAFVAIVLFKTPGQMKVVTFGALDSAS